MPAANMTGSNFSTNYIESSQVFERKANIFSDTLYFTRVRLCFSVGASIDDIS